MLSIFEIHDIKDYLVDQKLIEVIKTLGLACALA